MSELGRSVPDGLSQAEPEVSALRASIPSADPRRHPTQVSLDRDLLASAFLAGAECAWRWTTDSSGPLGRRERIAESAKEYAAAELRDYEEERHG